MVFHERDDTQRTTTATYARHRNVWYGCEPNNAKYFLLTPSPREIITLKMRATIYFYFMYTRAAVSVHYTVQTRTSCFVLSVFHFQVPAGIAYAQYCY